MTTETNNNEKQPKLFTDRSITRGKDPIVRYTQFEEDRLRFGIPVKKEAKTVEGKVVNYYIISITYVYVINGKDSQHEFRLEGPTMYAHRGIDEAKSKETGEVFGHSMGKRLDMSNENHQKFVHVLNKIYIKAVRYLNTKEVQSACGNLITKYEKLTKDEQFEMLSDPQNHWGGCAHLLSYKKEGDMVVNGIPPMLWSNLKRGGGTLFTDTGELKEDGTITNIREVPRDVLNVSAIESRPLYRIATISINAVNNKFKTEIVSTIVTNLTSKGNQQNQLDSMSEMARENAEASNTLEDQIAILMIEATENAKKRTTEERDTDKPNTTGGSRSGLMAASNDMSNNNTKEVIPRPISHPTAHEQQQQQYNQYLMQQQLQQQQQQTFQPQVQQNGYSTPTSTNNSNMQGNGGFVSPQMQGGGFSTPTGFTPNIGGFAPTGSFFGNTSNISTLS